MMKPIDLCDISPISIHNRENKVHVKDFAGPLTPGASFDTFLSSLPRILAGKDFRQIVGAICAARQNDRPVIVAFGAHVIKCGLSPIIIQLMERGVITALATTGAGAYHDVEIALFGHTSEDVTDGLHSGTFGMASEPCDFINNIGTEAGETGLGNAIGSSLLKNDPPYIEQSIFGQATQSGVPITVHVAVGTDVNHMHPSFDAAAWGAASHTDFRRLCALIAELKGGAMLNWGSAVLLPTIIEKAIAVTRNMGHDVSKFTAANFDFISHYRARRNTLDRANELGGKGYMLVGHHELLIPLLAQAILNELGQAGQ